jgi:hypothetical protein
MESAIQAHKNNNPPPSVEEGGGFSGENIASRGIGLAAYAATGLSLIAATIHLWVAPEHFVHWWGYGVFFVVCGLLQGLFVTLLLRWPHSQLIPFLGIWGNLLIVALYVISRTWGMPIGADFIPFSPSVAHMEDPEVLGMVATASEVGLIFASAALLGGSWRKWTVNLLLVLGALAWALRLTGILP